MLDISQYDHKAHKSFLKRTTYPALQLTDLVVGQVVTVFSRQLHIRDYGDEWTKKQISQVLERWHGSWITTFFSFLQSLVVGRTGFPGTSREIGRTFVYESVWSGASSHVCSYGQGKTRLSVRVRSACVTGFITMISRI